MKKMIIIMGNRCLIIFIAYKGLHGEKCPTYSDAELTMKEMIDICVLEKINESFVCRAVPQNVYYTKNFLIDLSKVDVSYITVDGVIYHSQACPSFSKTLKEHFLKRKIVKFEADAGKLCKYAVIKYKSCLEAGHMISDSSTF